MAAENKIRQFDTCVQQFPYKKEVQNLKHVISNVYKHTLNVNISPFSCMIVHTGFLGRVCVVHHFSSAMFIFA